MSERPLGPAPSRLVAVLGPTNTGKTHFAVERMLGHASGMIGLLQGQGRRGEDQDKPERNGHRNEDEDGKIFTQHVVHWLAPS